MKPMAPAYPGTGGIARAIPFDAMHTLRLTAR